MITFRSRSGMVCSVDHLASGAGIAMLRQGGTAADAAIATSAVLAVTTQHMCGMGGDLFALVHDGDPTPACLNASGRAGSGADPARLRDDGHRGMPFRGDIRAVPIPGCVDGWVALHDRFGRLPMADVLAPAIDAAENGFPPSPLLTAAAALVADVEGAVDFAAPLVLRPGLGRALRAVADGGRSAFYEGEFGEGLLAVGGGEYKAEDLARSQADWVEALAADAWDHTVWTVPPNSQGYLTLAAAAVASAAALPPDETDAWAHVLVEAARLAAHDRPAVLHEHADGTALVDRVIARAQIDPDRATRLAGSFRNGDTIYLCAVDADRMGVSLIQSNAAGFGAHITVPSLGIFLHNRGIGFSLEPGHPAEYGPGRRPPHTLAPLLVTTPSGQLAAVLGTMGGDAQPQVGLQLLARLLHGGAPAGEVIGGPRWALEGPQQSGFDTWDAPDEAAVALEPGAPDAWLEGLARRGHHVEHRASNYGHAHLIAVEADGQVLAGAADPRALTGAAAGY